MTESVWWYTLAGFVLGLILSTLWEWLYFRRRRMRMESRRIEELEAALRAQSAANRSAESNGPGSFAGGYQSPNVFLESEQETGDTVEVIVPEPLPAEPRSPAPFPQEQYTPYQQFATSWPDPNAPDGRVPQANGNGKARDKQKSLVTTATAATAATAAALTGVALAQQPEREPVAEPEFDAAQAPDTPPVLDTPPAMDGTMSVDTANTAAPFQPDQTALTKPPDAPGSASPAPTQDADRAPNPALAPASSTLANPTATPGPTMEAAPSPPAAQAATPNRGTLEPDDAPSLSPAVAAMIAAAFGSRLLPRDAAATNEDPPEDSEIPAEKTLLPVYDIPDTIPDAAPDAGEANTSQQPILTNSEFDDAPAAGTVEDKALPLSAILPAASKPPPLSKNGNAPSRSPQPAATAVPATGLEPEIEQVSNQLGSLIASLNGLIEKTQPLLDQPAGTGDAPGLPLSAGAPATRAPDNMPFVASAPGAAPAAGEGEHGEEAISGPYAARNLSRMEYAVVQLMQSVRRVGRDVRAAFE